jgi:predicted nucleic acid-binding protein
MIIYYFDSSAWVKRYFQENGTDWVKERNTIYQMSHIFTPSY